MDRIEEAFSSNNNDGNLDIHYASLVKLMKQQFDENMDDEWKRAKRIVRKQIGSEITNALSDPLYAFLSMEMLPSHTDIRRHNEICGKQILNLCLLVRYCRNFQSRELKCGTKGQEYFCKRINNNIFLSDAFKKELRLVRRNFNTDEIREGWFRCEGGNEERRILCSYFNVYLSEQRSNIMTKCNESVSSFFGIFDKAHILYTCIEACLVIFVFSAYYFDCI